MTTRTYGNVINAIGSRLDKSEYVDEKLIVEVNQEDYTILIMNQVLLVGKIDPSNVKVMGHELKCKLGSGQPTIRIKKDVNNVGLDIQIRKEIRNGETSKEIVEKTIEYINNCYLEENERIYFINSLSVVNGELKCEYSYRQENGQANFRTVYIQSWIRW